MTSNYPDFKHSIDLLNKQASILGFGTALAVGELGMKAVQRFGKSRDANFLRAGIELGKKGEKMNPFTETLTRNFLGNKQVQPYNAGIKIGERIKQSGMDPEREQRFLNKITDLAAQKKNASRMGRKGKDQTINAIENYSVGADMKNPRFQKMLETKSKPIESNGRLGTLAANAVSVPFGAVDFRLATRPLVRFSEKNKTVQDIGNKMADNVPMVSNDHVKDGYDVLRKYID